MIITTTGRVAPGLCMLGTANQPAFLLDVKRPALIDAGMTCMGKQYIRQIREILSGRSPEFLFLTHLHYDHCGAAPLLQEAFPDMEICCAETGLRVLESPRAVATIRDLNRRGARYAQSMGEADGDAPDFTPFTVDRPLADGDVFPLGGGLSLRAIATPGHTRDSMSFYLPEKKMLFTGEAVGVMVVESGYIFSEWLSSYASYIESMKRLKSLDVETLCPGHGCVLTGADAREYIARTSEYCRYFRKLIEKTLDETAGDVEAAKQRIKELEYDPLAAPTQPDFAYLMNLEAKIRAVMQADGRA